jgi:Domain of unknown function (DUF5666)
MKFLKVVSGSLLAASLLVFSACSSVASTLPQEEAQFVGIVGGSGTNLTLNGQRLDISKASITLDDESATASVLQSGMEVEVSGRSNSSDDSFSADRVNGKTRVKGQVDAVNNSSLEVVGVQVNVDSNTLVVNRAADGTLTTIALADIQVSDYLEVYGVPRNDDSVLATRIVRKIEDTVNKVELRVKIRTVDTTAKTFSYGLGTHTVNFANAEVRGALVDGTTVRFRGVRNGLVITAERVRTGERGNGGDDNGEGRKAGKIELEGLISNLDTTAKTFTILDFAVDYSKAEVKGRLSDGAWVEVKGRIDSASSAIVAREVKLEGKWDDSDDSNGDNSGGNTGGEQELTGTITSFEAASQTFMMGSTKITVRSATEYKDADNKGISASAFWAAERTNTRVKVEGSQQEGILVAREIKLR